jgi:hypothetical protein
MERAHCALFSDGDSGKYRTNGRRDYELSVVRLPLLEVRIKRCLRPSGGGIVQTFLIALYGED